MHRAAARAQANKRAEHRQKDPENKEQGSNHVGQDADIRIGMTGKEVDREKEKKSEESARGQHHSRPAEPVAKISPERARLRGSGSVRHCGDYLPVDLKSHPETAGGW